MLMDILKGFIVGIAASAPVGPIAILVVQKSLSKGRRAGFMTGLGAVVVDTIYAVIAIFALAAVQEFISRHENFILIAGGIIVGALGVSMTFSDPFRKMKSGDAQSVSVKDFVQAMIMGFSNPGAVFVMLTLFAFFGLSGNTTPHNWHITPIILSVSAGCTVYWFCVTALLSMFRKNFKLRTILWINRVTGTIIIIIGVVLLGEGLFRVLFRGAQIM